MTTNFSIENVVELVLGNFGTELNSGTIAKAVNAVLLVLEVKKTDVIDGKEVVSDYQVTPQMMNNYGKQGMFDKVKHPSMANVVFKREDVKTWLIKFVNARANGVRSGSTVNATDVADLVRAKLAAPAAKVIENDDVKKGDKVAPVAAKK
jgi:hypothetical protein